LLLLIGFECLISLFIWWRGVVIALGNQPEHRSWDMHQRQRRADQGRRTEPPDGDLLSGWGSVRPGPGPRDPRVARVRALPFPCLYRPSYTSGPAAKDRWGLW
jgi:hypothetical protein